MNIPTHLDTVGGAHAQESLKKTFERYGDVEVYACQNCADDRGWAFVGYASRRAVRRLARHMWRRARRASNV